MLWNRPNGNPIELKDTPNMEKFATDNGWTKSVKKAKKPAKKAD